MEKIGDYQFIRSRESELGRGSFSIVYLGIYTGQTTWILDHNQKVAIKVIKTNNMTPKAKSILDDEVGIMEMIKRTPHPNIVGCYDIIHMANETLLILEYCDSGDLKGILKKPIKEKFAQFYFCQLANGLKYLSQHNIIHRDIKPRNILLTDNRKILKIADFGFATNFKTQSLHETICGSPLYMAPEIMNNNMYNNQTDLWSIGMILYEMLFGVHPYNDCHTIPELKDTITNTDIEIPPANTKNKSIGDDCINLLKQLLQKKVQNRITWDDFFEDPWVKSYQYISSKNTEYETKLQSVSVGSLSNEELSKTPVHAKSEMVKFTRKNSNIDIVIRRQSTEQIKIIDDYCDKLTTIKQTNDDLMFEMDLDESDKNRKSKSKKSDKDDNNYEIL